MGRYNRSILDFLYAMTFIKSPTFQYGSLAVGIIGLSCAAYYGLRDSDSHRHHGHRHETSNHATSNRSHSHRGDDAEELGHFRVPQAERSPEHEALFASHLQGNEALLKHALDLLEKDPDHALEVFSTLTAEMDYSVIGDALLSFYQENGGLVKGLESFHILDKNPTLAAPLLKEFITPIWKENPDVALTFLDQFPDLNGAESAAMNVAKEIGQSENPTRDFKTVLEGNLSDEVRSSYFASLAEQWIQKDFDGAFQYFSELESSPVFDGAIYELIGRSATVDPQSSIEWAQSMTDEGLKQSAIAEIESAWKEQDQAGYDDWKSTQTEQP